MNNEEKNIQEENNQAAENASFGAWWAKLAAGAKAGIIAAIALVVIIPIVLVVALSGGDNNGSNIDNGGINGNGSGEKEISYSVTIKDDAGNPIVGAKVDFYIKNDILAEKSVVTDSNGQAVPSIQADFVSAKIVYIPIGYSDDIKNTSIKFDNNGKINATVEKLAPFVVRVVDQEGNPVAGVSVQVCDDKCIGMPETNENGESTYPGVEGNYRAQITGLPDGYTVEDMGTYYELIDNEVTIIVTKN